MTSNNAPSGDVYMNSAELAELLKISLDSVVKYRKKSGLPFVKIGKLVRYRLADVQRWIEAQQPK